MSAHLPRAVRDHQNELIGIVVLVVLVIVGNAQIEGFTSSFNLRSMLVLGSFLGVAAIGQTLCALVGGLDLSIPFVIGAANVLTDWLIGKGTSAVLAIAIVLALALIVGILNGLISDKVEAHSLVVTLAMGFVVIGAAQIVASVGSNLGGTTFVEAPSWLTKMTSLSGTTFGVGVPSVVLIWLVLSAGVVALLRLTTFGRGTYALGSNRVAARRALVREKFTWVLVFALSALMAGVAGVLLIGFSGGGSATIGNPYLFTTVAAVVIGGTSLLGGKGGYGLTILGVAILTVLQTLLVGIGLEPSGQQAVLGGVILVAVALYGREAHPRMQI